MALAQFASERFGGGSVAFGAFHRRRPVHYGRLANTGPQVHTEFVQRVPERFVRGPEVCYEDGRDAVRGASAGNIDEGPEDFSRIHV